MRIVLKVVSGPPTTGDDCIWNLTADTHITSFTGDASQIKSNSHRLYVNGKEMNIR